MMVKDIDGKASSRTKGCLFSLVLALFLAGTGSGSARPQDEFDLPGLIDLGLKNNPLLAARAREAEAKRNAFEASKLLLNPELEIHQVLKKE